MQNDHSVPMPGAARVFNVQLVCARKLVTVHEVRMSNLLNLGNATLDKAGFMAAVTFNCYLSDLRSSNQWGVQMKVVLRFLLRGRGIRTC